MKRKLLAAVLVAAMVLGLTACGDDKGKTDSTPENTGSVSEQESSDDGGMVDAGITIAFNDDNSLSGDNQGRVAAYNKLIKNVADFVSNYGLDKDYFAYDYMYFDYDQDEEKEVILYLEYKNAETEVFYRDTMFMDYNADADRVYVVAVNENELNDSSFYAEYLGKMGRYFWFGINEAYLYVVDVRDGSLTFVLEKGYDYLATNLEEENLYPIALYGSWEMIFEEE